MPPELYFSLLFYIKVVIRTACGNSVFGIIANMQSLFNIFIGTIGEFVALKIRMRI